MNKVLRYLTKEKLEWLVADGGLYFGPASLQSDEEEGIYNSTILGDLFESNPSKYIPPSALKDKPESYRPHIDEVSRQMMQEKRKSHFLNSWYSGDEESMEMWDNYAPDGVVVVSTQEKLTNEAPSILKYALTFSQIKYNDKLKRTEIFHPLTVKHEKFSYECEFRILFDARAYSILTGYDRETYGQVFVGNKPSHESARITAGIDKISQDMAPEFIRKKNCGYVLLYPLENIFTEVRINPGCSEQQKSALQAILSDAKLNIPVVASELARHG